MGLYFDWVGFTDHAQARCCHELGKPTVFAIFRIELRSLCSRSVGGSGHGGCPGCHEESEAQRVEVNLVTLCASTRQYQ